MPLPESQLRSQLDAAFASAVDPPGRITQHRCEECDSLNAFLSGRRREGLSTSDAIAAFANTKLHILAPRAVQYYFPAMAAAALRSDELGEAFLSDLLYFLAEGDGEKLSEFSDGQFESVVSFLHFVATNRRNVIEAYACELELIRAIERWSSAA